MHKPWLTPVLAFVVAAWLRIATPGAGAAVILNAAAIRGRRAALLAVLGCASGIVLWGVVVALGLGAVLQRHARVYTALQIAGALYLAFLAMTAIRRALRLRRHARVPSAAAAAVGNAFGRGVMVSAANPSLAAFYVLIAPQFVPPGLPITAGVALLAAIDAAECSAWWGGIVVSAAPFLHRMRQPSYAAAFEWVSAACFLVLSARLIAYL